jgi:hypothetical protein
MKKRTLMHIFQSNDGYIMHKVVKNDTLRKKVQNYVQNYVQNHKDIGLPI